MGDVGGGRQERSLWAGLHDVPGPEHPAQFALLPALLPCEVHRPVHLDIVEPVHPVRPMLFVGLPINGIVVLILDALAVPVADPLYLLCVEARTGKVVDDLLPIGKDKVLAYVAHGLLGQAADPHGARCKGKDVPFAEL